MPVISKLKADADSAVAGVLSTVEADYKTDSCIWLVFVAVITIKESALFL